MENNPLKKRNEIIVADNKRLRTIVKSLKIKLKESREDAAHVHRDNAMKRTVINELREVIGIIARESSA